jgi:2'-5' RNA ligase
MPRRRVVSRPPLPRRALVWLLPSEVGPDIERFRAAHDPLAGVLAAHLTFVFPFASTLGAVQIAAHVRRALARWPVLPVRLEGLGHFHADWPHLRVSRGHDSVMALHDRLYRGALSPFLRRDLPYEPHVTLARARDAADCDALLARARDAQLDRPREAVIRALTMVLLHDDGSIRPEAEFALG